MSNLTTLLLMEAIVIILVLLTTEYDLISPSFIFCASWLICTLAAIIRAPEWFFTMSDKTFWVILCGILAFVIIGFAVKPLFFSGREKIIKEVNLTQYRSIEFPTWLPIVTILLSLIVLIWVYDVVREIAPGTSGLNDTMSQYKRVRIQNEIEHQFILNQMSKITKSLVYVQTYGVIHNLICVGKKARYYLLPCVACITWIISYMFFSAARQQILEFLLGVFVLIIINMRKIGRTNRSNVIFTRLMFACILALPVFYFWGLLVGRNLTGFTPIDYVAGYLGAGFCHLDHLISSSIHTQSWGVSSFSSIIAFMQDKLNILTNLPDMSYHSAIVLADSLYVTTVTTFGRWYEDFGMSGVVIMSSLVSAIYHIVYYGGVKWRKRRMDVSFSEIIYIQILATLFFAGYDDHVAFWLSPNRIITLIIMYAFFCIFVKKGIRPKTQEIEDDPILTSELN